MKRARRGEELRLAILAAMKALTRRAACGLRSFRYSKIASRSANQMRGAYSESSYTVSFVRCSDDVIGNEFAAIGLREAFEDRFACRRIDWKVGGVTLRHRKQHRREGVLLFGREGLDLRDSLFEQFGHGSWYHNGPQKVRGLGVSRGLSTEGAVPGLHPNRVRYFGSRMIAKDPLPIFGIMRGSLTARPRHGGRDRGPPVRFRG